MLILAYDSENNCGKWGLDLFNPSYWQEALAVVQS